MEEVNEMEIQQVKSGETVLERETRQGGTKLRPYFNILSM